MQADDHAPSSTTTTETPKQHDDRGARATFEVFQRVGKDGTASPLAGIPWESLAEYDQDFFRGLAIAVFASVAEDDEPCEYFRAGYAHREQHGHEDAPPIDVAIRLGWDVWMVHIWGWGWQLADTEIDLGLARKAWERAEEALRLEKQRKDSTIGKRLDVAAALEEISTPLYGLLSATLGVVVHLRESGAVGLADDLQRKVDAMMAPHQAAEKILDRKWPPPAKVTP